MKDIAKILSLVLIVLLLLPVAKIDFEMAGYELKEYMNYFSVGLGIDQTLKVEGADESQKEKPDMSSSIVALLAIILIIAGAVFLHFIYTDNDQSKYIVMGIYGALILMLLVLPNAVENLEFDDVKISDSSGLDYFKMTFFYFISLLSAIGILGLFAKEKFIDNK